MRKNLAKIGLAAGALLLSAAPVFAQVINVVPNTVPQVTVTGILTTIIRLVIIAAFIIAFLILLIGGIRWMTAGGDPKNVEGARNMVTAALIGLVIVLAAFAIVRLIEFLFQINIISAGVTIPQVPLNVGPPLP